MAAWVKSIQISSGNFSGITATISMTEGQVPGNCFCRLTTQFPSDDISSANVNADVQSGPDQVVLTRASTSSDVDYTLVIIEVEPTKASVKQITFSVSTGSNTAAISAVDLSSSFVTGYATETVSALDDWYNASLELTFSSTTQLLAERVGTTGTMEIICWVVEAIGNAFAVQTVSVDAVAGVIGDATISSAVVLAETITFFSYQNSTPTQNSDSGAVTGELTTTTNYRFERADTVGQTFSATAFIVEMDDSSSVQRVEFSFDGAVVTDNITVTSVGLTRSMNHSPNGTGGIGSNTGRTDATSASTVRTCSAELSLTTSTNARGQIPTSVLAIALHPAEIVEFELAVVEVLDSYMFVA